jgi:hypothetical protein
MSISSLFAFVLAGAAVKNRADRREANRIAELEARIGELEDAIATANAHARRDQELIDLWRERALAAIPGPPPQAAPQIPLRQAAAQQAQAALQQQYAAAAMQQNALAQQQQQNALAQANYQNLGLAGLGAQGLIDAQFFCNCVPSRSQVWAAAGR